MPRRAVLSNARKVLTRMYRKDVPNSAPVPALKKAAWTEAGSFTQRTKIGSTADTRSFAASDSFTALRKYSKCVAAIQPVSNTTIPPCAASAPSLVASSQLNSPRGAQQSRPTAQNSTRLLELGSMIGATQYTEAALYPTAFVVSIRAASANVIFPASA